jgi:hypothetical protein
MKQQIKDELKTLYRKNQGLAHQVAKVLGCKIVGARKKVTNSQILNYITLDNQEFSDSALKDFKKTFKKLGFYLGDFEQEFYGEAQGDTYILYVAKKKLPKKQLKEEFKELIGEEE